MKDWTEVPEAAGPQTESESGQLFGIDYGQPGQISIGQPPRRMSIEQMEKERDADYHRWELRQRVERAAIAAGATALEAAAATDKILREAAETAAKS